MIPQPEISGGLLGQLRAYARQGSDENAWEETGASQSSISRSVTLKGQSGDIVRVDFEAKRQARSIGSLAMRTFFTLRAAHIQTDLMLEFLPQNVVDVLRKKKVMAGESEEDSVVFTWDSNENEVEDSDADDDEFYGFDEMLFRHQRSLEYTLDGRGKLIHCNREDFYEDEESDSVEIVSIKSNEFDSPLINESEVLALQGQQPADSERLPLELMQHPDLRIIEERDGAQSLEQDMLFLDIVQHYVDNRRLVQYTRQEHRRDMLTLLAFLRMEASAKDVQDLL